MGNVILVIMIKDIPSAEAADKASAVATEVSKILGAEVMSKEYRENL